MVKLVAENANEIRDYLWDSHARFNYMLLLLHRQTLKWCKIPSSTILRASGCCDVCATKSNPRSIHSILLKLKEEKLPVGIVRDEVTRKDS